MVESAVLRKILSILDESFSQLCRTFASTAFCATFSKLLAESMSPDFLCIANNKTVHQFELETLKFLARED